MRHIGRYRISGLLGRGGMAKVFKVRLPVIDKTAALKLLAPDPLLARLMGAEALRRRFVAEARVMAALHHPNIVTIHDFDHHEDAPFYVMAFFANNLGDMMGETYRVEQPSRRIAPDKVLHYSAQTLSGLACLHDAGLVHRDIKPFNLLVTAQDTVKICDFGLSRLRGETYAGPSNLKVGSPYYAAPEQETDPDSAGPAADLYALGVMVYRMLTGRLPAGPPHDAAYGPPSRLNSDLNPTWDRFVARAIAPRPDRRFPDAAAMHQALEHLAEHWRTEKERTCAIPPPAPEPAGTPPIPPLRALPIKAPPRNARTTFGLDPLWRPLHYTANAFATPQADIVADHATGLVWQRAGSPYPRTWQSAQAFIDGLNRQEWAGYRNWRLPTIDELTTLLRPAPQIQDLCQPPLFDTTQRWIWSADRSTFTAAYYADMALGFIGRQDFSAPYYVRAVRTP